jgi:hypothetical protein
MVDYVGAKIKISVWVLRDRLGFKIRLMETRAFLKDSYCSRLAPAE